MPLRKTKSPTREPPPPIPYILGVVSYFSTLRKKDETQGNKIIQKPAGMCESARLDAFSTLETFFILQIT